MVIYIIDNGKLLSPIKVGSRKIANKIVLALRHNAKVKAFIKEEKEKDNEMVRL